MSVAEVINGGRKPGDATQEVLWRAFMDCITFHSLKLGFLRDHEKPDKELSKAEILERWEEQARLDFSRTLEDTRRELSEDGAYEEFITLGIGKPDLGRVEHEFEMHLTKVRGMAIRVLDLI